MASERIKRATEWFYKMLYREEKITPRDKPPQRKEAETSRDKNAAGAPPLQELIPAVTSIILPKELREIRRFAIRPENARLSREELFVRQARLLENFEDDYAFEQSIIRYYPTYQTLRDRKSVV